MVSLQSRPFGLVFPDDFAQFYIVVFEQGLADSHSVAEAHEHSFHLATRQRPEVHDGVLIRGHKPGKLHNIRDDL